MSNPGVGSNLCLVPEHFLSARSLITFEEYADGSDYEGRTDLGNTQPDTFKTAEWYWSSRNGNAVADGGDINDITLMINGGYHGLAERTEYYNRGLQVLGR